MLFVQGETYRRRELHIVYGGQRQGGISTPAGQPIVIIFTGDSGEQYDYRDGFTEDGVFEYTGEGRRGDQQLIKGNAAIANHAATGRDIHLFKCVATGHVQYVGKMVCGGFTTWLAPDVDGATRNVLIFHLVPLPNEEVEPSAPEQVDGVWSLPMEKLREQALADAFDTVDVKVAKRNVYARSRAVGAYVLRRADGRCEACHSEAPFLTQLGRPYLEPHHIRRRSAGGPDHPRWVAGVCPNCHAHAHYAGDADLFNKSLANVVGDKEGEMSLS